MITGIFELIALSIVFLVIFIVVLIIILLRSSTTYPKIHRSEKEKCFFDSDLRNLPFPSLFDPWSIHLSVVVPAYDEAERLPPMLDECIDFLEDRSKVDTTFKYEIIIVSDGSHDDTVKVANDYTKIYGSDIVRVLDLETNRGKGGAVRLGMLSSRGAVLLFADADGATKFGDLSKLEDELEELIKVNYRINPGRASNQGGVVCGSRAHLEGSESVASRSPYRNFLMHGFHTLVKMTAVETVRDTQCGFKLMTRDSARQLFESLHVQRWAFDVELLYIAERIKIPIAEVDVNWTEIEGSKIVPILSWIQMGRDLILIWLRYKIGAWKVAAEDK